MTAGKNIWNIRIGLWVLGIALVLGTAGCRNAKQEAPKLPDEALVAKELQEGLKNHAHDVTVRFFSDRDLSEMAPTLAKEWMALALADSDDPKGGDYIRYQYGGYHAEGESRETSDGFEITVRITPRYYLYLVQEEEVDACVAKIMDEFHFDTETSEYERIRTIYDYVCRNIRYDRVHEGNAYHTLRSTAYGGLIWGSATCQGYCVSLYRLCKEAGISCRIVTGTVQRSERPDDLPENQSAGSDADSTTHAWNIVYLNGAWYALDATWDSEASEYHYFLKGSEDFTDHTPSAEFLTAEFTANYPLSEKSY